MYYVFGYYLLFGTLGCYINFKVINAFYPPKKNQFFLFVLLALGSNCIEKLITANDNFIYKPLTAAPPPLDFVDSVSSLKI